MEYSEKKERENILTFRIICTKVEDVSPIDNPKGYYYQDVYFTGYCECEMFTGTVTEGVDHQIYDGDECLQMRAEYVFEGVDKNGHFAKLNVLNAKGETGEWKPEITTDSEELSWLNGADLTADVEDNKFGPTIRIYTK